MKLRLEEGNKIYIKPSKRGSFTSWCGGKVTEKCILKGKNSPNLAIRKKAIFAENARKWEIGGEIRRCKKADEGAKLTFGLKVGNWINNNPELVNTVANAITGFISASKKSKEASQFAQAKEAEMKSFKAKTWKDKYLENLKKQNDRSDVVNVYRAYNQTSSDVAQAVQEKQDLINQEIAQAQQEADNAQSDAWSGLVSGIGLYAINEVAKNALTKDSVTTPTSTTSTSTTTSTTPTYSFLTSPVWNNPSYTNLKNYSISNYTNNSSPYQISSFWSNT